MGALDTFRWRVPVHAVDRPPAGLLAAKVEALVGLGAAETVIAPAIEPASKSTTSVRGNRRDTGRISAIARARAGAAQG